jgi:hypothetical protein
MANIRLKELVEASVDPKLVARSKESGKLVYFKTPQAKDAALKAGSHLDPKAKKGGQPKADVKPNDMFGGDYAKDRGGEAPKADGMATVNSIAAKTGMRAQAVAGWADENGVNLSKVSADIDSKKLNPKDLMTAVVGNPGNKYAKDIIAKYSQSSSPKSDMGVDSVVYNKRTKTVGIVRMGDERGETKTDSDGNVNTDELEPYNPMKYPHQKDAKAAPSTSKEIDARGLWKPFSQSDSTPATSKYDDAEYWKDDEYSDTQGYYDYDDEDSEYDYDDEDGDGVRLTTDRLNKVETALENDLDLRGNGFETTRESGGGMGGFEGPMTIVSKDADYNDDDNFISLSVGSPGNDGKFSIVFANANGEPHFEPNYDALTGDTDLEPQQAYKVTKALMKMPEVQKVLKGEMKLDEFQPIYDKLKSKFSKTESTKLTSMIKK